MAEAMALVRAGDLVHVEAIRREVLAFCSANEDALVRSNLVAHLTGSALVIDPTDRRFVVLHHRKLGRWLQPGGHADGEGDLGAVALREAFEETGLDGLVLRPGAVDLDVHRVRAAGESAHHHLDLRFVVLAPPGSASTGPPPGNHESHQVRWVHEADLDALGADPSLRRFARRAFAALVGDSRPRPGP